LASLSAARREEIRRRGEAILRRIRPVFPGDPESLVLDVSRDEARDAFFEGTAGIACPFLVADDDREPRTAAERARRSRWPRGFVCAIYTHRPHACRTFGLPLADRGRIVSDPCRLNFRGRDADSVRAAALPVYEPEEDEIASAAESLLGLPAGSATILPAVAAGRIPARPFVIKRSRRS
jgi:Fe-S-cluster containining protein